MARYIDTELMIDKLEEKMRTAAEPYQLTDGEKNFNFGLELATEIAFNMPTADVVEVVRCKDCKHNPDNSDDDICPFVEEGGCYVKHFPEDDGFCKWGERRDDE